MHEGKEGHARPGWTTSRCGQDSPWKSQSEWQRTGINGESTSMVWPTIGSRTAKEQEQEQERITDRSFQYASPCLWNQLTASLKMKITRILTVYQKIVRIRLWIREEGERKGWWEDEELEEKWGGDVDQTQQRGRRKQRLQHVNHSSANSQCLLIRQSKVSYYFSCKGWHKLGAGCTILRDCRIANQTPQLPL